MNIVWDEPKRLANLDKHGVDFADVTFDFFLASTVVPARGDRFMAIGWLHGRPVSVTFSRLGKEALTIVSACTASIKERTLL